ncbi:MAG TPA: hypothetical protein VIU46_10805 [Gallionellaceae bacterium]
MIRHKSALYFASLLLCLAFVRHATADELIDDITLRPAANGEFNLEIRFAAPVQYTRHFPQRKSPTSSIYFKILGNTPLTQWQAQHRLPTSDLIPAHRVPTSDLIRDITVSTTDPSTGPKIQLEFSRPSEFTVSPGRNAQTLVIHIVPEMPPQRNDGKTATVPPVAAIVPPVVAPAVVAAAPKAPAAPATAATAPAAASPVPAAASAVPSGDIIVPSVALPPIQGKLLRLPLGGKDGLPPFPNIEQVSPDALKAAPAADLSPAQQLKRTNDQAAALMLKGGKDLVAGQPFAATESFNGVLKLPPNRYTEDAQLWIGITREKSGQLQKAILEFQAYQNLYPNGKYASWVNNRLAILKIAAPGVFADLAKPAQAAAPQKIQNTEFQTMEFGSLGMYYYTGGSRIKTSGGNQASIPTISVVDQKTIMTNINMTTNTYNNEYDNRLVFQDFYARNLLPKQKRSNNRLGALFYEFRDRLDGYSARIGRQSGIGGGVMGRFDGISAGMDVFTDYRVNVVAGQLADLTLDSKPKFAGTSIDFGIKDPFGGSLYAIAQKADGLIDRKAVGGNLRYFNPSFNLMSMFDWDTQFRALNMFTLQGAYISGGSTDFNFIIDKRRSPILDVRNAVNGTVTPVTTLLQNGWTFQDLLMLANQRTGSNTSMMVGMTNHLSEKWNAGTDISIARNSGMSASGTLLPDGSVGLEGFVPAIPPSPNVWTISERLTGNGVIRPHDITNFIVSFSKGPTSKSESFLFGNHMDLQEKWALDTSLHFTHQGDTSGGTANDISPTARLTYRVRNNFSLDGQLGLDMTKFSNSVFQTTTTTYRYFASFGFQWNF